MSPKKKRKRKGDKYNRWRCGGDEQLFIKVVVCTQRKLTERSIPKDEYDGRFDGDETYISTSKVEGGVNCHHSFLTGRQILMEAIGTVTILMIHFGRATIVLLRDWKGDN
jgi:hypothetical protein